MTISFEEFSGKIGIIQQHLDELLAGVSQGGVAPPVTTLNQGAGTSGQSVFVKPEYKSGFKWSKQSLAEQKGVKPELISVANLALEISTQDFRFFDGVRTTAEQKANVASGASQTMNSKHMIQSDGYGWAMDLVPVIGGILKWDWEGCYKICMAVDEAATILGFQNHIRWGGVWDRVLGDFGGDISAYKKAVVDYQERHAGPDFIDGPHYEWVA